MGSAKQPVHMTTAAAALALVLAAAAAAAFASGNAVAASTAHSSFLDLRRQAPVSGDAQAGKASAAVCSACHGERGIGIAPNFPNLAGQSATYLYVQLASFKGGQRSDPIMAAMAASLGEADMRNLAAYYASLPPPPAPEPEASERLPGSKLFSDGEPARGIPPCEGCHGPGGRGPQSGADVDAATPRPPWSTVPRLRGQSGAYVAKALHDFKSGARGNTSNAAIMHGVANSLEAADIQSLADFVAAK